MNVQMTGAANFQRINKYGCFLQLLWSHVVIAFKLYEAFIFFPAHKIPFLNYDEVINTCRDADRHKILHSDV